MRGRGMRRGGEVIGSGIHMAAFLVMRGNIYIWLKSESSDKNSGSDIRNW